MANSDKDILITPNTGQSAQPKIEVTGANDTTRAITVLDDGNLSFDGSITTTLSGSIADGNNFLVRGNEVFDYIAAQNFASSGASNFVIGDITGQTALASGLASTDELVLSDAGALKRMDVSVLQSYMQSNLTFTTDTILTTENVQDIIGAMVSGGTETRIGVTYDDTNGRLNFVVDDMSANDNTFRGITAGGNTLGSTETLAFTAGSNVTITESGGSVTIASTDTNTDTNTQLSTEQVQDIVGGMLEGTETRIGVAYDDVNGRINFVVDDMTANTQLTLKDEDNMASNSNTAAASQQSIKAYVDSKVATNASAITAITTGAPTLLNTLAELGDALGDDPNFATTTATSLGNRLRIDVNSQGLNSTQQSNALTNLGITATLAEINILDDGLAAGDIPALAASKITSGTFNAGRIADNSILETKLNTTNTPTDNHLLSYDSASGGFTWIAAGAGGENNQNAFSTVAVSGQTNVAADATTDTLTFAAGSNVTITTTAGSDTITFASADTNTQLTQEQVEDFVNGLIVGGTNVTATYDDSGGTLTLSSTDTNTQLTTEQVQDIVGGMLVGTETRIGVTYDDTNGRINFVVDDMTANDNTFRTVTAGGNTLSSSETLAFTEGSNVTITELNGAVTIASTDTNTNTQLSTEQVQDIVGGMLVGTETRIGVDYDDTNGRINFVVDDMTTDTNTFRTVEIDTNGDDSANNTLTTSETLRLKKGSNITLAESGGVVTISSTDTNTNTTYSAGNGIALSGTTFSVAGGTGLSQNSNGLALSHLGIENLTDPNADKILIWDDSAGAIGFATPNSNISIDGTNINTVNTNTDTQLSTEAVQDIIGGMVNGGTETRIGVTYDDTNGKINFVVDDMTANDNTQLSTENVQDIIGNMVSSNTETRIGVTYDDNNGKLNFVVDNMTANDNTQLSQEQVEDFVGGMLDGTETFITVGYDDTNGNLDFVVPVKDEDAMTSNSATHLATQQSIVSYVGTQISNLVDSSPSALNTLNELAAALGDDASFSTTTATSLGNRLRVDVNNQGLNSTQQGNALTNLGITAGTNLSLSGTTFNVDDAFLKNNADDTTSGTITAANLVSQGAITVETKLLRSASNAHAFGVNTQEFQTGSANRMDISNSGIRFGASGARITTINTGFTDNDTSLMTSQAIKEKIEDYNYSTTDTQYLAGTNISLSGTTFNVDDAFLKNDANDTTTGTLTAANYITAGSVTLGTSIIHQGNANNNISFGSDTQNFKTNATSRIDISNAGVRFGGSNARVSSINTTFVDNDTSLMTSQAIKEKIENYNYTSDSTITTEAIQDVVGAMVGGNTETGISAVYQDSDGTIDFVVGTLNQDTTGTADHVTITDHSNTDENNRLTFVEDAGGAGSKGLEIDAALHYNPSTQKLTSPNFAGDLVGDITGTARGLLSVSNGDIAINPNGTGKVSRRGTPVISIHPDTGDAASANTAQSYGITKVMGSSNPISGSNVVANNASFQVPFIVPSGGVVSGNCDFRAIKGTIHIDAGLSSNNFVLTQDFIANDRYGNGTFEFLSYGMVHEGVSDFPFEVSWAAAEGTDMPLVVKNVTGANVTSAIRVYWDLTLFPKA